VSSIRRDAHCTGNRREMAGNESESVRSHRTGLRTQNSPSVIEIATAKLPSRWRKVSADDNGVYVPLNALIVIPSRNFVFG